MQSCQKSGRRTCGITPACLSPKDKVSSQHPAEKKCICLSAHSYHPWSIQYVVDAANRAHVDWVTVLLVGWCELKLFSN